MAPITTSTRPPRGTTRRVARWSRCSTPASSSTIPISSRTCGEPKEPNNGRDDDGNGYIDDVQGVDIVTGRGSGTDKNGHGTHVAGIIGARGNNDRGISGLCWKVKILDVRILDAEGRGYVAQQVAGIEYALRAGAKVINCSFGGPDSSDVMRDAIAKARSQGR